MNNTERLNYNWDVYTRVGQLGQCRGFVPVMTEVGLRERKRKYGCEAGAEVGLRDRGCNSQVVLGNQPKRHFAGNDRGNW